MTEYTIVRLKDDEPYRYWGIYNDTFVIQYGEALCSFLLLGSEKALLIDTAFGRGEFPLIVEELKSGLPLEVVNTHGHYDHTGGNPWFPKVHMHKNAKAYANKPFKPVDKHWFNSLPYPDYEMAVIDDGFTFDLGHRQVEVLYTPAHSDSSLSFIDSKHRLFFSGDEFDSGQANLSDFTSVEAFLKNMKRIKTLESRFDFIMPSHNGCPIHNGYIDDFITAAQNIVDGRPDFVSKEGIPEYKQGFNSNDRAQIGNSCINFTMK